MCNANNIAFALINLPPVVLSPMNGPFLAMSHHAPAAEAEAVGLTFIICSRTGSTVATSTLDIAPLSWLAPPVAGSQKNLNSALCTKALSDSPSGVQK